LNNLQHTNQIGESQNISFDKNNANNKVNITNKLQIPHEPANNNLKINVIASPNPPLNANNGENIVPNKYSISNLNQINGNNNINYSNVPIKYDNLVASTLHNKPNLNTLINNSINPQENIATNKNVNEQSPEAKKKEKKAKCCFS